MRIINSILQILYFANDDSILLGWRIAQEAGGDGIQEKCQEMQRKI